MSWTDALSSLNDACRDTFGAEITITPSAGAPFTVEAIPGDPAQFEAITPGQHEVRWVKQADCPAQPKAGDVVVIGTGSYVIHDVQDDRGGGWNLFLDKR
jgi:hypothetical protein